MIYRNNDESALNAMERHRLGNYGDEPDTLSDSTCTICHEVDPQYFYVDEYYNVVGCDNCLRKIIEDYRGRGCPKCGQGYNDRLYMNDNYEIVGCDNCLSEVYGDEYY